MLDFCTIVDGQNGSLMTVNIDNYMIWNKHGEEEQPQRVNSIDEIMQEPEFNILFDDASSSSQAMSNRSVAY